MKQRNDRKILLVFGDFHYLIIVICDSRDSGFKRLLTVAKFPLLPVKTVITIRLHCQCQNNSAICLTTKAATG
jgi:hypothetical protein